jgi:small-conductance mechanosensitive channel
MLFLFVEHAFDVGDLLEVEAVQYRVKKIDLQFIVSEGGRGMVGAAAGSVLGAAMEGPA